MTEPDQPRTRITLRRALLTALAVLVPVVPIVIGLVLSGGSSPASAGTTAAASRFTPAAPPPGSTRTGAPSTTSTGAPARTTRTAAPPATSTPEGSATTTAGTTTANSQPAPAHTTTSAAAAPTAPAIALPAGKGALVALVRHKTRLRSAPGGRTLATLATHTEFGSPTTALVTKLSGRWLGVITTAAGNNKIGWIRAADVSLSRVDWTVHAVLSRHELIVSRSGRTVKRFTIAVGKPDAPTPTGRFAVTDRLNTGDPAGPYGCCILALSAKAPHAISGWNGGDRIAIHSTPETASIGRSVSHGCMRLTLAEGRWLLLHVPLGTPVDVST